MENYYNINQYLIIITIIIIIMMSELEDYNISDDKLLHLLKDPDSLPKWMDAIKSIEESNDGITKKSSTIKKSLLRSVYLSLLKRFPNLENYWIRFANLELSLGNTSGAEIVFLNALKMLPYSLKIWVEFLRLRINLSNFEYLEMKNLFKSAELKIGSHYHSSEFWELYLDFEENYNAVSKENMKYEIFLILRKVIELPLHQYSYFYSKFSNFLSEEINFKNIRAFLTQADLAKLGLANEEKVKALMKAEDSAAQLKELKVKVKKIFTDLYISNAYEVFKIYQYESKLKRQYFHTTALPKQELDAWDSYLNYLEIKLLAPDAAFFSSSSNSKKINKTVIQNNLIQRIILTHERCLISTALYDRFWVRYFWFLINIDHFADAKNILMRASNYIPVSVLSTKLLLIDAENYDGNYLTSRDMIMKFLAKFSKSPSVWKPFLDSENLLLNSLNTSRTGSGSTGNESQQKDYVLKLMDQSLQSLLDYKLATGINNPLNFDVFFQYVLSYDNISVSEKLAFFKDYESSIFKNSATYWTSLLKFLVFNKDNLFVDTTTTTTTTTTENETESSLKSITSQKTETPISYSEIKVLFDQSYQILTNENPSNNANQRYNNKLKLFHLFENIIVNIQENRIKAPEAKEINGSIDELFEMHVNSMLTDDINSAFW